MDACLLARLTQQQNWHRNYENPNENDTTKSDDEDKADAVPDDDGDVRHRRRHDKRPRRRHT